MFDEIQIIPNENVVEKAQQFKDAVANQMGKKINGQIAIFLVECCAGHDSSLVVECGGEKQLTVSAVAKLQAEFAIWCHEAIKALSGEEDKHDE